MNAVIIGIQSKGRRMPSDKITEREALTRMAPDYKNPSSIAGSSGRSAKTAQ